MNLTGIISISGKPGLYKVVAQGKNNIIVESLEDKKRVPAYSSDRISSLEDISIYSFDEDVPLREIFKSIYEKEGGKACISHKEDKSKLESYLIGILPNYDTERVYHSDIKKIFQWYNLLHKAGELKMEEEKPAKAEKAEKAEKTEKAPKKEAVAKEAKPAKAPAKKAAPKAAVPAAKASAKSAAPKKVTAVKTGGGRGK